MDTALYQKMEHLNQKNFFSSKLFSKIRYYVKLSKWAQEYFLRNPNDCEKYQNDFNLTLDKIYEDIIIFEKNNISKSPKKVTKIKERFEKKYRHYFLYGEFIKWSLEKPYGYAGDFKIIDSIYQNSASTVGFDRLWDNYFQQLAISRAVRERKEDFKKIITGFVKKHTGKNIRILSLASGPAREIKELLESDANQIFAKVVFDCFDSDQSALNYAKQLLNDHHNVNFYKKNAIRLAIKNDIAKDSLNKYDLIYSTGLFDYFSEKASIRLVENLIKIINKDGMMVISNVRDKFSNSSAAWMEWVAEWYLVYRSEEEFRRIFVAAKIPPNKIEIIPQHSNVMQYCFVHNIV